MLPTLGRPALHFGQGGAIFSRPNKTFISLILYTLFLYILFSWFNSSSDQSQVKLVQSNFDILQEFKRFNEHQRILIEELKDQIKVIEDQLSIARIEFPSYGECRDSIRNSDPNHQKAHYEFWRHLPSTIINRKRQELDDFVKTIPPYENFAKRYFPQTRGVVFTAGNGETYIRTLASIRLLRYFGCNLPVEVWHLDDEISIEQAAELREIGAIARNLSSSDNIRPSFRRKADKNFQIKSAAIINSGFQEVLYLDSDNNVVMDPTFLFETPEYKSTGAIFWPDYWKTHPDNAIYRLLELECHDEWEQESGQIVLDKSRSWEPLQLSWYMQSENEFYFQLLNGDKDTFRFAWKALKVPFHMTETFVSMVGDFWEGRFCGHTMVQYVPGLRENKDLPTEGVPLFMHANLLKITDRRSLGWTSENPDAERPFQLLKWYSFTVNNTWLKPDFYIQAGRACMDFRSDGGEPDMITEDFDLIVPNWQKIYKKLGGLGGEVRSDEVLR